MIKKDKLLEARTLLGWSQTNAAEAVNVHYATYRNWENGTYRPDAHQYIALCIVFDIDPVDSIDDEYLTSVKKNIDIINSKRADVLARRQERNQKKERANYLRTTKYSEAKASLEADAEASTNRSDAVHDALKLAKLALKNHNKEVRRIEREGNKLALRKAEMERKAAARKTLKALKKHEQAQPDYEPETLSERSDVRKAKRKGGFLSNLKTAGAS